MSDSNNITVLNPGLYKNLLAQVESIYKHSNELSFKTRARYFEATKRFCKFLADNYRLQNFKNVEDRHFKAYVEHLKENNSAATIQSDLSGIRYFHRKSGSKNRLSPNSKLALPKRATGVKDHSLLDKELVNIRQWAIEKGRQDAVIGFDFASEFGLRLEKICTLRVEYLMSALKTGQLVIMVIASRNGEKFHYFDTKSSICKQIFRENLTIPIAMNIEHIQITVNLNVQKPIKSVCLNTFVRLGIL